MRFRDAQSPTQAPLESLPVSISCAFERILPWARLYIVDDIHNDHVYLSPHLMLLFNDIPDSPFLRSLCYIVIPYPHHSVVLFAFLTLPVFQHIDGFPNQFFFFYLFCSSLLVFFFLGFLFFILSHPSFGYISLPHGRREKRDKKKKDNCTYLQNKRKRNLYTPYIIFFTTQT